jgi:hypothetical protein
MNATQSPNTAMTGKQELLQTSKKIMLKKFLKFFVISFIVISVIIMFSIPIIVKYLTGTARIVGKPAQAEIFIDGKEKSDAKLFISNSNFEGTQKRDYLILYLDDVKDYNGIPVLIIDKKHKVLMFPNSGKEDYDIIFKNLFQSDSGANVMIPVNNKVKGLGFEPDLIFEDKVIKFKISAENKIYDVTINIS